ncbi:MAG: serine/threonine protein phosphatase [Chitinophagales bacterium]|nr:serine/threonine protein phosphatase [Chitinophagales bacterium]
MNTFIVGDVHGCFNTLKALLQHCNFSSDQLVFVGDLIDRGAFSPETVHYVRQIQFKYPDTIVLMGNHEFEATKQMKPDGKQYWFNQMGEETILQYAESAFSLVDDLAWMEHLPLVWQNEDILVSHAGICDHPSALDKEEREHGILWTRKALKNMNKIQVHGHTPIKEGPIYSKESNSWNIDTACVYGGKLSAMHFNEKTKEITFLHEEVHPEDLPSSLEN